MKYLVNTLGKRGTFCKFLLLLLVVLSTSAWGCEDREPEFGGRMVADSASLSYTVRLECLTVTLEDDFQANRSWRRANGSDSVFSGFLNVSSSLRGAMARNRDLRVLVISGYHDLTTAFFGAEYLIDHANLDPKRVLLRSYQGGHMMYLDPQSFEHRSRELAHFVKTGA